MNSIVSKEVEAHLDEVFSKAAQSKKSRMVGKRYKFTLFGGLMLNELRDKGECIIEDVYYDSAQDCDMITFIKQPQGSKHTVNQFALDLSYLGDLKDKKD